MATFWNIRYSFGCRFNFLRYQCLFAVFLLVFRICWVQPVPQCQWGRLLFPLGLNTMVWSVCMVLLQYILFVSITGSWSVNLFECIHNFGCIIWSHYRDVYDILSVQGEYSLCKSVLWHILHLSCFLSLPFMMYLW